MKTTEEMLGVMKAYIVGKAIEYRSNLTAFAKWTSISEPNWDWPHYDYRVKEEPKYRPFDTAEEFLAAQKEHGAWLKRKGCAVYSLPIKIGKNNCIIFDLAAYNDDARASIDFGELYDLFVFQDGTPCGIKE